MTTTCINRVDDKNNSKPWNIEGLYTNMSKIVNKV